MDLDPAIIIPALLFTAVAIYFASSYLNKKPDASAAAKKKPKVGYGDDIPPSRALGQPTRSEPAPVKVKTMMTKEEIEEEQRVQQEQLAAIFLLLRENQEALGEVTEGEMEEQLKLYSL
ncbi:hypothetical protein F7725_002943 [Dissostichus mawsoni]|uniref:Matrix-remodeling-associated protein 7 helical domain-containing protein n=1 Tax=Dissostichus mawsoni TaxID=36200 RepID=A0A7J5Y8X9_DISMA|nr:hypothetical protein F7725_002943 [Dissostichus mawsoni]